jgi:general secretion pathway protein H
LILVRQTGSGSQPTARPPGPAPEGGFTLLELVCVLMLLALLTGLVMPGLLRAWQRERDRANLRQLAVALRTARSEAATRRLRVRLFIDLKTGVYRVEGGSQRATLTGMRLTEASLVWQDPFKRNGYFAFYADGSSSGGKLTLIDPTGQRHILEVAVITGRVTLRDEAG